MSSHAAASKAKTYDVWGVGLGYEDALGRWQTTEKEVRAALHASLRQLGIPPVSQDGRAVVVRQGVKWKLPVGTHLRLEDGTTLRPTRELPPDVPLGYHSLEHWHSGTSRMLFVAPPRCYLPDGLSIWGWSVQLYAARSVDSWGIGDFADLRRLGTWSAQQGASLLLLNPPDADTPVAPLESSPYSPSSRCFRNIIYVRVEEVPGADHDPDIQKATRAGRALNAGQRIDRDEVFRLKLAALRVLWKQFEGDTQFDAYCREQGSLLQDFVRFCVLAERFGRDWRTWPEDYRHPRSSAVQDFADSNRRDTQFHAWVQWILDTQLARAAQTIRLMHDLPIGVDPGGADAWIWQNLIVPGVCVGAPPDKYNPAGQNWGLATFAPHTLSRANYEPFIQTIRAALRHAGGLRIDHVMGLFRLYCIPPGADPAHGAYVYFPADDLLGIIALESHRAQAIVVGEDLGTLDEGARRTFASAGLLSYRLLWFEEGPTDEYPPQTLAAVSTHDLPTIAGLWSGQDQRDLAAAQLKSDSQGWQTIRDRLQLQTRADDDAPVEDVIRRVYRRLARAPSAVVTASLDDALAVEHRPNMPSTVDTWPNWSQPLPGGLEALEQSPLALAIVEEFNNAKGRGRRRPPAASGS